MSQVSKIIFPNKPHLDPIAAYWVLLNYGHEQFPGIKKAGLAVWKAGKTPEPQTLTQWQNEGVITFDIEGGTFDHHGTNKCTTLLVAEKLGIEQQPELQTLLRYIQEDDSAGLHNNFGDLAGIIKCLYKRGDSTEEIIKLVLNILNALQTKEKNWHIEAKAEFEQKAKIFKIKHGKDKKIKLAVIVSDNIDVANYAKQNEGIAIVVQKNSQGHIFIFTNAFHRLNIKDMVAAIRLREAELNGKTIKNPADLKKPGKTLEVQNWFFHDSLNALMNGSAALVDTPATKIPLAEIVDIVVFGLSSDFPAHCPGPAQCQKHDCQYYKLLFSLCRR
jgi:hypothetical protein